MPRLWLENENQGITIGFWFRELAFEAQLDAMCVFAAGRTGLQSNLLPCKSFGRHYVLRLRLPGGGFNFTPSE